MTAAKENLNSLSSEERLKAYQTIVDGCHHAWSKGKPKMEKVQEILDALIPLVDSDPYFLAHLTSYVMKNSKAKDLRLFLTYVSSLSSADGSPFSIGSKYSKPNLRYISSAATQMLDPKMAKRLLWLASHKFEVQGELNLSRHFPTSLKTALKKYIKYREQNLEIMRGIKKAGLGKTVQNIYRGLHMSPSDESAAVLRWQQKDHHVTLDTSRLALLKDLDDLAIAERIRKDKLPVLGVLGALPRAVSPVIAVALLEQATGNQAVILRKTFEDSGVLKDKEVMKLYTKKISTAKTALDRVDNVSKDASEAVKRVLKQARSIKRKEETAGIGKVFLHIDISPSMSNLMKFAMERGAIIAECVNNPAENFRWGLFDGVGQELPLPEEFVQDAFGAILFGRTGRLGGTDSFALYKNARDFGADVDVFVTDMEHNGRMTLTEQIKNFHDENPDVSKPKACVIINFGENMRVDGWNCTELVSTGYENNGIPVALMKPETLTESALVAQAVKSAMMGPIAQVDEIMDTPLLELPKWYYAI